MKSILVLITMLLLPVYASADCKQIYNDVEENLKDIAAFNDTAKSYLLAGYTAKSNSFDTKIANAQNQIKLLLDQAKSLKCSPYKESLNPDKYANSVKKCGESAELSEEKMNYNCDRKNWIPE